MQTLQTALSSNPNIPLGTPVLGGPNIPFSPVSTGGHQLVVSTTSPSNSNLANFVRKCLGKNKQAECHQQQEHPNTRWECNFMTESKDEFTKHCKNIYKRVKWRTLVDEIKPDGGSLYRCVYFSTDKHHVENHYAKANNEAVVSPNSSRGKKYNNYQQSFDTSPLNVTGKRQKGMGEEYDESYETPDAKKIMIFGADTNNNHANQLEYTEAYQFGDNTKTINIMADIEKKLQIPQDMCNLALERLHQQGFYTISNLRSLQPETWNRLNLPLAIEEELKKYLFSKPSYSHVAISNSPSTTGSSGNLANLGGVSRGSDILTSNGRISVASMTSNHGSNAHDESGSSPQSPTSSNGANHPKSGMNSGSGSGNSSGTTTGVGSTIGQSASQNAQQMLVGFGGSFPPWVAQTAATTHHAPSNNQNHQYYVSSYGYTLPTHSYASHHYYDDSLEQNPHTSSNASVPSEHGISMIPEEKDSKAIHHHDEHEIQENLEVNQMDPNSSIRSKDS